MKNLKKYNHSIIEKKWQRIWEKQGLYEIDLKKAKRPYYNLMMFPYPSAEGLHVGNTYAFTGADVHGRFRRLQGFDVFEPMGFDAFGIHSENFAIKKRVHPKILIEKNINNFRRQLKNLGCIFDWRYEVDTTKPEYYKWTQWLFLQLFKAGLAYRKKAPVDWCPSCKTVLADEQVISGKCERCGSEVIQKETEQWFFKITKYADKLLKNLEKIDWSERTKITQKNWIGKSEGFLLRFQVIRNKSQTLTKPNVLNKIGINSKNQNSRFKNNFIEIFTTRIDTLFGATYLVIAPEHPFINRIKNEIDNYKEVKKYIDDSKKKSELERISEIKEKSGVELKGLKAINPANNKLIPIFIADYILMHYGTGAIMAVPAHDQRDYEFAKKYNLPVIEVIKSKQGIRKRVFEGNGYLINSGNFTGMDSRQAKEKIGNWLKKKGFGEKSVFYKLRDWLISRQRYWGPPIPVVFCENCKKRLESSKSARNKIDSLKSYIQNPKFKKEFNKGELENPGWIAVPEKDLPVLLPYVKNFRPKGSGKSPLATVEKFVKIKCPKCGKTAKRETDVSDTFLDSSWYFFRYLSANLKNKAFDEKLTQKWLPVDMYIGGQEHAVLHLLYTRFITMALKDLGYINFEEPFKKFRAHGLITKDGAKMSKSKGNVVNPDDYYKKYGADALRMYLMFLGPFFQGGDWQDKGIIGIERFLKKVWKLSEKIHNSKFSESSTNRDYEKSKFQISNSKIEKLLNKTIKKITDNLENFRYNIAISGLMVLVNEMAKEKKLALKHFRTLLIMLSPFAPYISEELWSNLKFKGSVHSQKWPKYDSKLIKEEKILLIVQINGKVRDKIETETGLTEKQAEKLALKSKKIQKWLKGKKIKKIIFVKGRLINLVI